MRRGFLVVFRSFILLLILSVALPVYAARSRLMGMGDLSIVIEDESNMINLWDFAGNPAAFLSDEKGSILQGDFIWDTYHIEDLPTCYWRDPNLYITPFRVNANGDFLHNRVSLSFRRGDVLAVGLGGNYLFRQTDSRSHEQELNYPSLLLVVSKSLDASTSVGASLTMLRSDFQLSRCDHVYGREIDGAEETVTDVAGEIGVTRELPLGPVLGAVVGYGRVEAIEEQRVSRGYGQQPQYDFFHHPTWPPGYRRFWFSGQVVGGVEGKIKLGMEGTTEFLDQERGENQRRFRFKLRAICNPLSRLQLAGQYSDGNSFTEYHDPVYSYFSSVRHETSVKEWGGGLALKPHRRVLMGIEYLFGDYPQPLFQALYPWALETHSVKVGVEGKLSRAVLLRGGYVNSAIKRRPKSKDREDSKENALTLGLGYQSLGSHLTFELSYRLTFKKYNDWHWGGDLESDSRALSFSFKRNL